MLNFSWVDSTAPQRWFGHIWTGWRQWSRSDFFVCRWGASNQRPMVHSRLKPHTDRPWPWRRSYHDNYHFLSEESTFLRPSTQVSWVPSIPYAPWCWNIYQHLPHKWPSFVGKYTIHGACGHGNQLQILTINVSVPTSPTASGCASFVTPWRCARSPRRASDSPMGRGNFRTPAAQCAVGSRPRGKFGEDDQTKMWGFSRSWMRNMVNTHHFETECHLQWGSVIIVSWLA